MSNKSSTFAPEIGIDMLTTCSGKTDVATQGCDLEGIAGAKTHTASAREKREDGQPISPFSLFVLYSMKPTYILLWEIIFDTLRHLWNRCTHL